MALFLAAQEEIKDGKTYVNHGLKLTFSIPAADWGKLRTGAQLEWRWSGGLCEFVEAKANVCGCLAVEESAVSLEEYVKQFEEGLKKNEGSKKLELKEEQKLPDGRLQRIYLWEYKEWSLTYLAVFLALDKKVAKLCQWVEARSAKDHQKAMAGIAESFRWIESPKIENPWTQCGEGSWAEHRLVSKSGGIESESSSKRTLVKKTADELVFRIDTRVVKPTPAEPTTTESKVKISDVEPAAKEVGRGQEELEIAGKKLRCAWIQTETDKKLVTKTWTCEDVPGGLVKSSSKGPDFESEMSLVGFEKK